VLGAAALVRSGAVRAAGEYPFSLGVASGYPGSRSVVLWTRLAPRPDAPDFGMGSAPARVAWELATDEAMRHVVRRGEADAVAAWSHSARVEPQGLEPGRWYWYRFIAGGEASPVGRTRTAPASAGSLKLAFASCQNYEAGWFCAYPHLVAEEPDLVAFLGDYIYETAGSAGAIRTHGPGEARSLADYRRRYTLYKRDPALAAAHAACPWILAWDDHEVANDYAAGRSAQDESDASFHARRAAAYRAYFENLPLPASMAPSGTRMSIGARVRFGGLAEFFLVDNRSHRSVQACGDSRRGGLWVPADCAALGDERRTFLGRAQERWLHSGLSDSAARWKVIAQQTLLSPMTRRSEGTRWTWNDSWDGYPAARRRLVGHLRERRIANPVVIGGDIHAFIASDVTPDPAAPAVATEFVGGSITSEAWSDLNPKELLTDNPHLRYLRFDRRGYAVARLDARELRVDFRSVASARERVSTIRTLASFVVEDGRPGVAAGYGEGGMPVRAK
jgi:alkaline phosphatase D